VTFAITADQDAALVKLTRKARKQGVCTRLLRLDGKPTDRWYKTATLCIEETAKSLTLITLRWPKPKPDLLRSDPYCYHVIATNDDERKQHEVNWFLNGRGHAENYNKELKNGFGMDYSPYRSLTADAVYLEIRVLAYNLTEAVKRLVLGGERVRRTTANPRWQLLQSAGNVVPHGRHLILRVHETHLQMYRSVSDRLAMLTAPG